MLRVIYIPAAMLAAALWGSYEALASTAPFLRTWAATTTAALAPAALALMVLPVGLKALVALTTTAQRCWQALRLGPLARAVFVALVLTLAATALLPELLRFEPAVQISLVGLALPLAIAIALLAYAWGALWPQAKAAHRLWVWAAMAITLVWLASLWQPVSLSLYFVNLAWLPESALVMMMVFILTKVAMAHRWSWALLMPGALGAVGLICWHLSSDMPNIVSIKLERQRELSSFWLGWFKPTAPSAPTTAGGTCHPGVQPADNLGAADGEAPDIIFLTIDGVAWKHTSFADPETNNTPQLRELAQQAAVFSHAYTPAPWTRQAFRSLFTGLDAGLVESAPATKWGVSFVQQQKTLVTYLRDAGYDTITLQSQPNVFSPKHNALLGFTKVDTASRITAQKRRSETRFKVHQVFASLLALPQDVRPRFLWTHILDTHFPYLVGPGTNTTGLSEPQRHGRALQMVDAELARVLNFALHAERRDKTYVIVTSDHGEGFAEHGNHRHGYTVYEEEIRVPLLIWGPGIVPGQYKTPISNVRLAPTLLEMAGLSRPGHMCGESLLSAMQEGQEPTAQPVFSATLPDKTTEAWKLAWIEYPLKLIWSPGEQTIELFDLQADPNERQNLADARPNDVKRLQAGLSRYLRAQGREGVPNDSAPAPVAGPSATVFDGGQDGAKED